MMEAVPAAERLCFRKKKVDDSKLPVTYNHSPFRDISVEGTVQNVLHWPAGVRTVLDVCCFTVHFNSLNLTYQLMHFYIQ